MYDKLGELLNEALENEEIPQKKPHKPVIEDIKPEEIKENQTVNRKIDEKIHISSQKAHIPTGEVIKMHKYTENMHIPPEICAALGTLHLVYPTDLKTIKKQYHKLLKQIHPDTKTTIQTSESVQKTAQEQITELKCAFSVLKSWYTSL